MSASAVPVDDREGIRELDRTDNRRLSSQQESGSASLDDEKKHDAIHAETGLTEPEDDYGDHDVTRPFPIDEYSYEEPHQLTFRAVLVGSVLGAVVGASNIYLGLKTGFTFGPQFVARVVPESGVLGWLFGGPFGPKENCTVQSAATAAGGLGVLAVSAVPAIYRLELLSAKPAEDIGKLIALTVCAGFFGVFFVIPLRKYYIVHQKLTFPTPAATAITIRSLHQGTKGAIVARKKALALLVSFVLVFIFKVMTGYAPGILYDWHIGWTLYRLGFTSIIAMENYGWFIEFTPAFFGAGMLSGMNASWSFFLGTVLAWGIISPSLVKNGLAVGVPISEEFPLVTYQSLRFATPDDYINAPSPRYWNLWVGVLIMLCYSFADITLSMIPIVKGIALRDTPTLTRSRFEISRWTVIPISQRLPEVARGVNV